MGLKNKISVLVVDDSQEDRDLIKKYISKIHDLDVIYFSAEDSKSALELLDSNSIDLIYLDFLLKYENEPMEFISKLRDDDKFIGIPIIITSSVANEEDVSKAILYGATSYVSKGDLKPEVIRQQLLCAIGKKKVDESIKLKTHRMNSLWNLAQNPPKTKENFFDTAIEAIEEITDSKFSFCGEIDSKNEVVRIYSWSKNTMNLCSVEDESLDFPLRNAGFWANSIREKKSIIYNDCSFEISNKSNSIPKGHVSIERFMSVPIIDGGEVKIIAAVANKEDEYLEEDIRSAETYLRSAYLFYKNTILKDDYDKSEIKVKEGEDRYKKLFKTSIDGILILDFETNRFVDCNSSICELLEYSREEILKLGFVDVHPEDALPELARSFEELKKNKVGKAYDIPLKTKSGKIVYCDISSSVSMVDNREMIFGFFKDISDRKEKEELNKSLFIKSKLASLGELSAGVAHEVNNPLAIILGNLEIIENSCECKNNDVTESLEISLDEVQRIKRILNALYEYSKADSGKKEPVDANEAILKVIKLVSEIYKNEGVSIKTEFNVEKPKIFSSDTKFRQCIMSLLSNSKESFSEGNGEIIIKTMEIDHKLVIEVKDNGSGIESGDLNKIFDMFYTTKGDNKGAGIGLSLTQSIINSMGGEISVTSTVNVGTCVKMVLPLFDEKKKPEYSYDTKKFDYKKIHGNVLIVDDEEKFRTVLNNHLKDFGLDVDEACDGVDALEKLRKNHYDFMFLDIKMPKMTGDELLIEMNKEGIYIPKIAILSGCVLNEFSTSQLSIIEEAFKVLRKPIKMQELYKTLTE